MHRRVQSKSNLFGTDPVEFGVYRFTFTPIDLMFGYPCCQCEDIVVFEPADFSPLLNDVYSEAEFAALTKDLRTSVEGEATDETKSRH